MKNKILEFIKVKNPTINIIDITSFEVVDYDGDHGFVGENYIVDCIVAVADTSITINNSYGRIKRVCLVNISELNKYIKKEESVKWL